MTVVLYCEGSLCLQTGAAGWGAVLKAERGEVAMGGTLEPRDVGSITRTELEAVSRALASAINQDLIGYEDKVVIAMRSAAPLAVLRWVFADADWEGAEVQRPKKLKADMQNFAPLFDLSDDAERFTLSITLRNVAKNPYSLTAHDHARAGMEVGRSELRSAQ